MQMTQDEFKVQCWNEFIKQDKQLNDLNEEGEFAMDMARIMPNNFDNIKKVCNGEHEGECFHSYEQFIISLFEMKEEGRGDFYKFDDEWFIVDCNHFLVSAPNADEMIGYIIENSGLDWGKWDQVRENFNEFYMLRLENKVLNKQKEGLTC